MASRFFATLGTQMQALVVSWQIYELTKSPLALGMIGLVEAVVFISFSFWAGRFADRKEKRIIILASQSVLLLCAVLLMQLSRAPALQVWRFYGVIALTGLARSYLWPASFAFSELTVPREIYARAAALNSTGWEVGSIVGPALGGFVYAWRGPVAGYEIVVFFMLVAIGLACRMGKKPPAIAAPEQPSHGLLSGARFVFCHPVMLSAIALDMFAVLFGGAVAILPIFADLLHVGARGLGWLRASPSIGAILMAVYQSYRPPFERAGRTLLAAVAFFGACMIVFALSTSFWLSFVLLAASGMADNVSVVIRASIMQAYTPNAMRGRVSSVNGIFIGSSNEIGAFESGLAAQLMGTVPSVIFGGVMTLLTVAVACWKFPALRGLQAVHKPNT